MKGTLAALQRSADVVSAFCILFDLTLSMTKFRAFMIVWGNALTTMPDMITIHTTGWHPVPVQLESSGSFKHLGVVSSLTADSADQHREHLLVLRKSLGAIRPKRLSLAAKWMGIKTSLYSKIAYSAKFESLSLHQLEELDVPVQRFLRDQSKMPRTFPSALLFAEKAVVGLGFERLSQRCINDKEAMFQRLQRLDGDVMGGLMRRAFVYAGVHPLPNVFVD